MDNETQLVPRELRHDLRGRMNGLKLCVAALESGCTPAETLEFLGDIDTLCDKITVVLDKLDAFLSTVP
jgi:hypothetical protein